MTDIEPKVEPKLVVHLNVYSEKSAEILKRVRYYMFLNWGSKKMSRNAVRADVVTQPNDEITWNVYDQNMIKFYGWFSNYSTIYIDKSEVEIRKWLCSVLKEICYRQFRSNKQYNSYNSDSLPIKHYWNRTNDMIINSLSDNIDNNYHNIKYVNKFGPITVAQVYCLYEKLLDRSRFTKKYSQDLQNLIVGQEKDTVATQLEIVRREELEKLYRYKNNAIAKLKKQRQKEIEKEVKKVEDKYNILEDELIKQYEEKAKKLDNKLNFMTNTNSDPVASTLFS